MQNRRQTMSLADQGPFADYLRMVVEALSVPSPLYCLVGALAINAWGRVRSTRDIDLLVLSREPVLMECLDSLKSRGFQLDMAWMERSPMAKHRVQRFSHPSYPGIPLDLILSADSHEESTLGRRQTLDLLGVRVWVCSPEDLILMKLKASRPHDFEDALSVIKNPRLQLDLTYLWNWADRLGLHGELQYVLQAASGQSSE
jgi:hypothetical protein